VGKEEKQETEKLHGSSCVIACNILSNNNAKGRNNAGENATRKRVPCCVSYTLSLSSVTSQN